MNVKKEIEDNVKKNFFDGFFNEFTKYPFGSMSKRDLECLIFSLMETNGLIEGCSNRDKAYSLGINTNRLNSYMVDSNVKFGKKSDENSVAQLILNKLQSNSVSYEDNSFVFAEENPVLREDFIQAMKNKGYYTDTSHNREIIRVKAVAILDFLTGSGDITVLKDLMDKVEFNENKLKEYFIIQKSWKDIAKDLFGILKDSEGDAIKLLLAATQYSLDFFKANKNNKFGGMQ